MPDIKFKECKTATKAIVMIASGVIFFLTKHPYKTIIALIFMLSGPTYIVFDYFSSDRAKVELAKPIGENVATFSLMPEAVAATKDAPKDSIIIDGKLYGWSDPGFKAWKILDQPVILLWDKDHGKVFKVEAPVSHEKLEQFKK